MLLNPEGIMMNKGPPDAPPSYAAIAPPAPLQFPPLPSYAMLATEMRGVPPELQPLLQVNQVTISEKFSSQQGWGRSFEVQDVLGQRMYRADQHQRCCLSVYDLKIMNHAGQDFMTVLTNTSCCCRCYDEIEVAIPSVGLIGTITRPLNRPTTVLSIFNPQKELVLVVVGPGFQTSMFGNCDFEVKSRDEQHLVGLIKNESNRFTASFPLDLDVTMKAMLLACSFYLEFIILTERRSLATRSRNN